MSLGSLTGGGMFVGTIVCGLIVRTCGGIACRGSLLRDISMYAISVYVVRGVLESGTVTSRDVHLFLGMYFVYVMVILCSDLYHKKVTLQRIQAESKMRRTLIYEKRATLLLDKAERNAATTDPADATETTPLAIDRPKYTGSIPLNDVNVDASNTTNNHNEDDNTENDCTLNDIPSVGTSTIERNLPKSRLSVTDRFAMMMSNYDPGSVRWDLSSRSTGSDPETDAIRPVVHNVRTSIYAHVESPELEKGLHTWEEGQEDRGHGSETSSVVATEGPKFWTELFVDAYQELVFQANTHWNERIVNESSLVEKMGTILELPFSVLRSATVPVPCEDHYIRPLVALSTAISPIWLLWYLGKSYTIVSVGFCAASLAIALCVLRFTDDDKMPLMASVPLALYGFFIAATWIDVIGNALVGILELLGTLTRIPSPILGLTVLAWGNSMGDLSANVAMARKGMPDMATTGCFAGPSFNLLVGTGLGFLSLQHNLQTSSISPVALTPSIRTGFLFITMNCLSAIIFGMICKWKIPHEYSYVFFALYVIYVLMCVKNVFSF